MPGLIIGVVVVAMIIVVPAFIVVVVLLLRKFAPHLLPQFISRRFKNDNTNSVDNNVDQLSKTNHNANNNNNNNNVVVDQAKANDDRATKLHKVAQERAPAPPPKTRKTKRSKRNIVVDDNDAVVDVC